MSENFPRQIVIIGGGAAGFFAAIACAEGNPAAKVIILEKGREVLQKVRVSGGGRCNVTHACFDPKELVKNYPRGDRALLGPFHKFQPGDTIAWFESRGVKLKIEEDGRMFPVTNDSQTIIDCLLQAARNAGVKILTSQNVTQITPPVSDGQPWKLSTNNGAAFFDATKLMIATGSSFRLWEMLSTLGHRIIPGVPSLFTFNIKDRRIEGLLGISVPFASVRVLESRLQASGPLLITHWGMSGPAILRLSAWGARELHGFHYHFTIEVNWLGSPATQEIIEEMKAVKLSFAKKTVEANCPFDVPNRLWKSLVAASEIDAATRWADLNKEQTLALATQLTAGQYSVKGKSTFKEEFVTAGGVHLDEVDFRTFESKIRKGLFLAGEVLDIDAITGGFNFQAAWTGGWLAGREMGR